MPDRVHVSHTERIILYRGEDEGSSKGKARIGCRNSELTVALLGDGNEESRVNEWSTIMGFSSG